MIYQPSEADPDRILTRNRIRMAISPNGKKRRFTLHKLFFLKSPFNTKDLEKYTCLEQCQVCQPNSRIYALEHPWLAGGQAVLPDVLR